MSDNTTKYYDILEIIPAGRRGHFSRLRKLGAFHYSNYTVDNRTWSRYVIELNSEDFLALRLSLPQDIIITELEDSLSSYLKSGGRTNIS